MCITEYDEERTFAEFQEEAREEGRAECREEGALKKLIELVRACSHKSIAFLEEIC